MHLSLGTTPFNDGEHSSIPVTRSQIPKIINLASNGLRRYPGIADKQKSIKFRFILFTIFFLGLIGNLQTFLKISNQNIQDINRKFDVTINHFGHMVFAANQ